MSPRPQKTKNVDLLAAAGRAIGRVGPARLTLADVANEAGVAPATLVQRFGSKRGLLLSVARQGVTDVGEPFREARRAHASPLQALVELLVDCAGFVETPEAMANHLAFLQMDLGDAEFYALSLESVRRTRDEIRKLLDEAVRAGELARCDTRRLARTVQVVWNGALIAWAIYREGALARWLRDDLEAVLAPYRAAPSRRKVSRGRRKPPPAGR